MKFLDIEHHFLTAVVLFNGPASEVELANLLPWKLALIEHVGQKYGTLPVGTDQPDHPELNARSPFPLFGTEACQVLVGRG